MPLRQGSVRFCNQPGVCPRPRTPAHAPWGGAFAQHPAPEGEAALVHAAQLLVVHVRLEEGAALCGAEATVHAHGAA